jgi:HD-GYP domain-containing protein (c-di-GMP phosphodiesterase class II)
MKEIPINDIEPGVYFSHPVYLDERYILLAPDTPFTEELKQRLLRWEFRSVRTEGNASSKPSAASSGDGDAISSNYTLDYDVREQERMKDVAKVFVEAVDFTEQIFTAFVTKNELPIQRINDRIKALAESVKEYRPHILRFSQFPDPDRNYIVVHSVKTAILAIALGQTMKLPPHKLIELGIAALLHEIGMIRLPAKLYMSDKQLSPEEKRAIYAHSVLSFRILKSFSFPMPVCLAVLESHERLDGQGYPRGLTAEKISIYAKIIAVAGSYAALVSKRPYRDAETAHAAVLELLKGRNSAYEETILRALVLLLSLYPVGTYVMLANGAKGIVVQTNEAEPKAPHVRVLRSPEGDEYMEQPVVETTNAEFRISRALNPGERAEISKASSSE